MPDKTYRAIQRMTGDAGQVGIRHTPEKVGKDTGEIAAIATEDIPHEVESIARGTVAAQHHEWTAWVDGRPWDWGKTRYRIVIEGDQDLGLVRPRGPVRK